MNRGQNIEGNIQAPKRCPHSVYIELTKRLSGFVVLEITTVITFWEWWTGGKAGEKSGAAGNGPFLGLGCDYADVCIICRN